MKTLKNQKGFTLIELIMVIVILGILSAVAVPKYFSLTQDAEYGAVQGVVGALNAAAAIQFAKNRLVAETGNGTGNAEVTSAGMLGGLLNPALPAVAGNDYPKWTINTHFIYTGSKTWTCTFVAEVTTAGSEARATVAMPAYAGDA